MQGAGKKAGKERREEKKRAKDKKLVIRKLKILFSR